MANFHTKYPLLHSRSIRVLDLQPSRSGFDEIRGDLRVVALDDDPSYAALSYTWGNTAVPSKHIICAGEKLPITANCHDALRRLRGRFRITTIWIDSICINQSDSAEQGSQVTLMRFIYGKARKVYIWLGEGNKYSDYALDWLVDASVGYSQFIGIDLSGIIASSTSTRDVMDLMRLLPEAVTATLSNILPQKYRLRYSPDAMEDIVSRDWFTRMWPIQELMMAHEPIVVCGTKRVRWNRLVCGFLAARKLADIESDSAFSDTFSSVMAGTSFWLSLQKKTTLGKWQTAWGILDKSGTRGSPARERLFAFMETHGKILALGHMFCITLSILVRFYRGVGLFDSKILAVLVWSLFVTVLYTPPQGYPYTWDKSLHNRIVDILHTTRARQATIQVDKVFALYGVLTELGVKLDAPNYEKSTSTVYAEFTRNIINWSESLDILKEASGPWLVDLPTWAPDWSSRQYRVFRGESWAARDSSSSYSFSKDGIKIITRGIAVETVTFCIDELQELPHSLLSGDGISIDTIYLSCLLHNVRILVQWMSHVRQIKSGETSDSVSEAQFAIIHSETDFMRKDYATLHQSFDKWYSVLTADYSNCNTSCPSDIVCALALSTDNAMTQYHRERCNAIAGKRKLFTTSNGFIGTGPLFMQPGDRVSLIAGFSMPMLLREAGTHFQVVGVAYVHGMMKGEEWPGDEAKLLQLNLI